MRTIDMTSTTKSQPEFHEFLKSISNKFSIEKYDLFSNNCNNFTDECCRYLLNLPIPEFITGLPNEVLKTPFGQVIKNFLSGFQ